jgi:hypothetical protein
VPSLRYGASWASLHNVRRGNHSAGAEEARFEASPYCSPLPHPPWLAVIPTIRTCTATTAATRTEARNGRSRIWHRSAGDAMRARRSADQTSRRLSHLAAAAAELSTGILGQTVVIGAVTSRARRIGCRQRVACRSFASWSSGRLEPRSRDRSLITPAIRFLALSHHRRTEPMQVWGISARSTDSGLWGEHCRGPVRSSAPADALPDSGLLRQCGRSQPQHH